MGGEAVFPLDDPDGVARLPSREGSKRPKSKEVPGKKNKTLEKARRKMEQVIMDTERERIRRQLETYCAVEPNGGAGRAGHMGWGYSATQSRGVNSDLLDVAEAPAAPVRRKASRWFSGPSEPEPAPQVDFSRESAVADGNHQEQVAVEESSISQPSMAWEPEESRERGYFSAPTTMETATDTEQQRVATREDMENMSWLGNSWDSGDGFGRRVLVTPPPMEAAAKAEPQNVLMQEENSWRSDAFAAMVNDAAPQASMATSLQETDMQRGTRERTNSRWFGLKDLLGNGSAPAETPASPEASRVPVLAVFSLAGGAGKTSLAATLGRTLSARGERVLLMETTSYGMLPYFFGARERRPGEVRTFRPPASSTDAPLQLVSADFGALMTESSEKGQLPAEIAECARNSNRVIVDIPTAATETARWVLRMSPTILVPLVPDMNSVLSAGMIESIFRTGSESYEKPVEVYFVLNQFDSALPLHMDVRDALRERLGERLLPFTLRRTPAISEALAEGMTVMDYAPESPVAEDFNLLGEWLKAVAAPANTSMRGMRWSESA
jgi:cellulose synthase operon protein YhjQ